MSFEFFDHTADVGARILASSVDELFAEAAIVLTTTITDPTLVGAHTSWEVALQAPDLEQLLVEWMSELIGRFDIDQLLACAAAVRVSRAGGGWCLDAIVQGEKLDSARHPHRRRSQTCLCSSQRCDARVSTGTSPGAGRVP